MNDRKDKMFEHLILIGAVEPSGMDMDTGEMLFNFSPDLDKISPNLARIVADRFSSTMMSLWSKGFLELKYDETSDDPLDPLVFLTDKCNDEFAISVLPDFENIVLTNIIRHLKQDEV